MRRQVDRHDREIVGPGDWGLYTFLVFALPYSSLYGQRPRPRRRLRSYAPARRCLFPGEKGELSSLSSGAYLGVSCVVVRATEVYINHVYSHVRVTSVILIDGNDCVAARGWKVLFFFMKVTEVREYTAMRAHPSIQVSARDIRRYHASGSAKSNR